MNNKCSNSDHCGTTPLMFPTSDRQFVEQLFDFCHLSNFQSKQQIPGNSINFYFFLSRSRCQTLSKAFDISQNTVQITSRFSNDKQILW